MAALMDMAHEVVCPTLGVHKDALLAMFRDVCDAMPANPYHNFKHVCDVTQAMYLFLNTGPGRAVPPLDRSAMLLAAVCHDLEHPGKSSVFQVSEHSELAMKYGNDSPLERHHVCVALRLLQTHGLLSHLSEADATSFQKRLEKTILATDMAKHGGIMSSSQGTLHGEGGGLSDELVDAFASLAIKCADVSNPARPLETASVWNQLVYEEFYAEGDADRTAGRKVNPLHDRETNNISKSTVGFINFCVLPLYELFRNVLLHIKDNDVGIDEDIRIVDIMVEQLKANAAAHSATDQEALLAAGATSTGPAAKAPTTGPEQNGLSPLRGG